MSPFGTSANLLAFGLLILFPTWFSSVASESARETETWMPPIAVESLQNHPGESSEDFGFTDNDQEDQDQTEEDYYEDYFEDLYDEDEDYEDEASGSGDANESKSGRDWFPPTERPEADNEIPEPSGPAILRDPEPETAPDDNEIRSVQNGPRPGSRLASNVLMSHAAEGVFTRMEVLAALICSGGVALTVAVLLVVLLLHRMKKKDEGSYELARKPIYTKAPTAEIYA
ncbi:syndecan-4 isoform X2 [Syngnathus scovelli]|uniref:syndecan-4 isoform X2 n=1 Tax=Syngnathus scovelli TaxID=161590 RepID=UPI00210F8EFC|nr:syndecan-4 isoform X2 [Syngnathus scovelli]